MEARWWVGGVWLLGTYCDFRGLVPFCGSVEMEDRNVTRVNIIAQKWNDHHPDMPLFSNSRRHWKQSLWAKG